MEREPAPAARGSGPEERHHEIEVAVLGPVEVRGAARPLARAWSLDLVVYLAMHPRGASTDAWATALWPERVMAPPTVHSTVSAARRALGRSSAGHDHLPHRRGSLALAATVGTDWDRFQVLADTDDDGAWRDGLALVRGRPFEGLRSADWTVLEGMAAMLEEAVVALALRLADHALRTGDGPAASAAARRGLLASPYDERLYRLLFRAADLVGNPAGVERAMADLRRLLDGDARPPGRTGGTTWADSCVHPETAALYRTLTRRSERVGGRVLARL